MEIPLRSSNDSLPIGCHNLFERTACRAQVCTLEFLWLLWLGSRELELLMDGASAGGEG